MKTFGQELREMRDSYGMTQAKFAEKIGVNPSTYYALESGTVSAQSNSAKKVVQSRGLSQFERLILRKAIKKEDRLTEIAITDADRLAYRRRKNEKYAQEMELPQKVRNKGIKVGYSKTAVQRIFY